MNVSFLLLAIAWMPFVGTSSQGADAGTNLHHISICNTTQDSLLRSGIVIYDGFSFALTSPPGWTLDADGGSADGLAAVIYPEGSSWEKAQTVMYVNVLRKHDSETVANVAQDDVLRFRSEDPKVAIEDAQPIEISPKRSAIVKHFFGQSPRNHEAVAYIENGSRIVIIALSSRTKDRFDAALTAFRTLVVSYFPTSKSD